MRRYRVEIDENALEDLRRIKQLIAEEAGSEIAQRFIDRALDHFSRFEIAPKRGCARNDLRPGLRIVGWRRTLTLAFIVDDDASRVLFIAVLYRGRDVAATLKRRL